MTQPPSFGPNAGRLQSITSDRVKTASQLVLLGEAISLNLELSLPPFAGRPPLRRTVRLHNQIRPLSDDPRRYCVVNDDVIELALQGSTQLDAFAHFGLIEGASDEVYFGGHGLEETYPQVSAGALGIHAFQPGIVTRGVLLDFVRLFDCAEGFVPPNRLISRQDVDDCLQEAHLKLGSGDAVLCFTGFQALPSSKCR